MKTLLKIISFIGLALTIIPAFLVFQGSLNLEVSQTLMLVGTLCWFFTTPFWMNKKAEAESEE